jgi:poly(A) polymerase Pap1
VNREEDFFIVLHDILSQTEEVTHLQPVPDAHVPVMKFKFNGISIDLLYASVSLLVVPSVSLFSTNYVHAFVCLSIRTMLLFVYNMLYMCFQYTLSITF